MLNLVYSNPRKQGDVGLGVAIGWFVSNAYTVSIPLTDSQFYDLIVEKDDVLLRVQVKTTRAKSKAGVYKASLRTNGGNRSGTGKVRHFDSTKVDLLFIVTESDKKYLIPTAGFKITAEISLTDAYRQFLVR